MSTWGVYGVQPAGAKWVLRYRVDGATRQRTFSRKSYATEAAQYLEKAKALRWDADAKGWPVDPGRPSVVETTTAKSADGPTFAAYATDWMTRNALRWAPGGRDQHAAAVQMACVLLRLQDGDARLAGRADRSIRLGELTLADLERAINDRYRVSFKGHDGAALRDAVLTSGERVPLAATTVTSPRTVQAFAVTLGMVMKQAQAEGLVAAGLWQAVRPMKVRDPFVSDARQVPSLPEVVAVADDIAERGPLDRRAGKPRGAKLRAAVLLCGTSGLRPGEATGLLTNDVHLDAPQPYLVVRQTMRRLTADQAAFPGPETVVDENRWSRRPLKHRAPGATRRVPIHPQAVPVLQEHLARYAGPELFLSTPTGIGPLDWSNTEAGYWRPACRSVFSGDRSFLSSMAPKMLRKAALTDMLARGISPYVVAALAGHDPATLLKHYAGVIDQRDLLDVWGTPA